MDKTLEEYKAEWLKKMEGKVIPKDIGDKWEDRWVALGYADITDPTEAVARFLGKFGKTAKAEKVVNYARQMVVVGRSDLEAALWEHAYNLPPERQK